MCIFYHLIQYCKIPGWQKATSRQNLNLPHCVSTPTNVRVLKFMLIVNIKFTSFFSMKIGCHGAMTHTEAKLKIYGWARKRKSLQLRHKCLRKWHSFKRAGDKDFWSNWRRLGLSLGRALLYEHIPSQKEIFINYCVHGVLTMKLSNASLEKTDTPATRL